MEDLVLFRALRIPLSGPQFAANPTPTSHSKENEQARRLGQTVSPLTVLGALSSDHLFIVSLLTYSTYA